MISVIITTYKREPALIIRALHSVLSQTYKDIEIIVVDDSPADFPQRKDVEMAVEDCQKANIGISISYIQHEKNRGACAARNTGLNYAKGEYIAYLDDDDEWIPEKLEKQLKVMQLTGSALVYCGRLWLTDATGLSRIEKIVYYKGDVFKKLLYSNFIGSTSFPLIKTQSLKEIGGFDEQMQSAQDCDVWLRIAENNIVDYVEEPLVIYHEHEGEQITSNPLKKISGLERLNIKFKEYLDKDVNLWYRRHIVIIPYYCMAGDEKKAMQIWHECARKCPWKVVNNLRYLRVIKRKVNING